MWLYILMLTAGLFGLVAGFIKAKRSGDKKWHILTAAGTALAAAGLVLTVSTLLLLGRIASQEPALGVDTTFFSYEKYGKDTLTDAQKSLYDEMYPKIAALEPFSYDAATFGYDTLDDVLIAWSAISADYPEIANYFQIKEVSDVRGMTLPLDARYLCKWDPSRSEDIKLVCAGIAEFESAADDILSGLSGSMTAYEKYLYLAEEVSKRADYDYAGESGAAGDPWGGVVGGLSICQGFSEAYQYLCKRADLWCRVVSGAAGDDSHGWNLIKLPEGTYHVDITWADEQGEPGSSRWMRYFRLTQSEIEADHVITDGTVATGK